MVAIGNYDLSDRDFIRLCEGLERLLPHYQVNQNSLRDCEFLRQMKILKDKLNRKKPSKRNV